MKITLVGLVRSLSMSGQDNTDGRTKNEGLHKKLTKSNWPTCYSPNKEMSTVNWVETRLKLQWRNYIEVRTLVIVDKDQCLPTVFNMPSCT